MTQLVTLPLALRAERSEVDGNAGRLSFYSCRAATDAIPLLLVHSVNAAASAYEVLPLFDHYRTKRPVYALDLPGFGFSERTARRYTPQLMTEAVHAMLTETAIAHGERPIDVIAISLGCEFVARAASVAPEAFRSVGFISPTGFNRSTPEEAPVGATRAMPIFHKALSLIGRSFFDVLTTKASIRYFLRKTWGSNAIDEGLADYDYLTAHQPGAHYAPYAFVSGYLFSKDIQTIYRSLKLPVWMVHGIRGDFTDYSKATLFEHRPNWTIKSFPTGALPHFEVLDQVVQSYDEFSDGLP